MNNIFDIRRFSLEDGEGIRTVVFFKGCHLRCKWCHNPESQRFEKELKFIQKLCVNCNKCAQVCPLQVHQIEPTRRIEYSSCKACGRCTEVCPSGALKMVGSTIDYDELIEIILKDKAYYESSGGGVTISGGEPLHNFEATLELAKRIKVQGVHVALETTGMASLDKIKEISPYIDTFLYDYKHYDKEKLALYTKAQLNVVETNLNYLLDIKKEVILRAPIIKGVNYNIEHFRRLEEYLIEDRIKALEILPYHSFGEDKYNQLSCGKADENIYPVIEKEVIQRDIEQAFNNTIYTKLYIK